MLTNYLEDIVLGIATTRPYYKQISPEIKFRILLWWEKKGTLNYKLPGEACLVAYK